MDKHKLIPSKELIYTTIQVTSSVKNIDEFLLTNIYINLALNHSIQYSLGYDRVDNEYFVYVYEKDSNKNIICPYVFLYKCLNIHTSCAIINEKDSSIVVMKDNNITKLITYEANYEIAISLLDIDKIYIVNSLNSKYENIAFKEKELKKEYMQKFSKDKKLNIIKQDFTYYIYTMLIALICVVYITNIITSNNSEFNQLHKQNEEIKSNLKMQTNKLNKYRDLAKPKAIPSIYNILSSIREFKLFISSAEFKNNILYLKLNSRFDGNILDYISKIKNNYKVLSYNIKFIDMVYLGNIEVSFE